MPTNYQQNSSYERDFLRWTEEQAQHLRDRNLDQLDFEHLIEEVLSMGKSEIRALESRLAVLLSHLLKWAWQPVGRSRSWEATIEEQRFRIQQLLEEMPSLRSRLMEAESKICFSAWKIARYRAEEETKISFKLFPTEIPWTLEQILQDDWFPESVI